MASCPPIKIKHWKEISSTQKQVLFHMNQYQGFNFAIFTYVDCYFMVSLILDRMCKYSSALVKIIKYID